MLGSATAARRFRCQGRQRPREGRIAFQIWFPKGKCVVLGLSDFFVKRNGVCWCEQRGVFGFRGGKRSRRRGEGLLKGNVVSGDLAISKMFLNVVSELRGC